jgi:hypothetical protein
VAAAEAATVAAVVAAAVVTNGVAASPGLSRSTQCCAEKNSWSGLARLSSAQTCFLKKPCELHRRATFRNLRHCFKTERRGLSLPGQARRLACPFSARLYQPTPPPVMVPSPSACGITGSLPK